MKKQEKIDELDTPVSYNLMPFHLENTECIYCHSKNAWTTNGVGGQKECRDCGKFFIASPKNMLEVRSATML